MKFAFIGAKKARHSVPMLCLMLKVSRSGYYAWRGRGPSLRALEDARLGTLIVASHRDGRGTYGSPRILDDLGDAGERVSRKRVARLMTERNLVGEMKKRWRHPSSASSDAVVAPNTLDRAFNVPEPNRVWASDITYVRTHEGWLYLAVVIDLFSRRVVGWSIQSSLHTDIVLSALTMAVGQRLPGPGLLQHSDRGSQYTSDDYQRALSAHGIACSFSGRGIAGAGSFEPWVYEQSAAFEKALATHIRANDVVVTHHLPAFDSVPARFARSAMNAFFVCDMASRIRERRPKLWIHEHSHDRCDYLLGKTRVVARTPGSSRASTCAR